MTLKAAIFLVAMAGTASADTQEDVLSAGCGIFGIKGRLGKGNVFRPDVDAFIDGVGFGLLTARTLAGDDTLFRGYTDICRENPHLSVDEVIDKMVEGRATKLVE